MSELTEEDAVIAFAKAWNRLEPGGFLALLAPDARNASQWVFEELVGADAIETYENKTPLEGIVSSAKLAEALKAELVRFFTTEFDPLHWDLRGDTEPSDDHVLTKDIALNHPWVASSR